MRALLQKWLPAVTLITLVLVCYFPALGGDYVMDDELYVTKQPLNESLDGLRRIWFEPLASPQYYPLLHTSFWLQYQLWQLNPVGYHAVNVLFHVCIALLAWRILVRLQVPGAWLGAAIFALHPVCVESVAWVTKLMNLQSMLLSLASMWCYLRFEPPLAAESGVQAGDSRWLYYTLSLALFLLALLSKTMVATLPAVLLVMYWWRRGTIGWRDVEPLIPFFISGAVLGLMTAWFESNFAGAQGAEWSFTFLQRCLIAGRAVCFYAGKILWPYPLLFYYPRWTIDVSVWWQWLYPMVVLAVVTALWLLRHRIGRGPLAAVLIYKCVLFPALGFFNVYAFRYSFVTDHWQYHAMPALIVLAAAGITVALRRLPHSAQWAGTAACTVLLVTLGALTWRQCQLYADASTLYESALRRNTESWLAYNNLGAVLVGTGQKAKAIEAYRRALRLNPDYAEAHYNLAIELASTGLRQEAIEHYKEALRSRPDYAEAHHNLGVELANEGQLDDAIEQYQQALHERPDFPEAHNNLGLMLISSGRLPEAIDHYRQAMHLKPEFPQAHFNLGNALASSGQLPEAIEHFQLALRLNPDFAEAHGNLGIALAQSERLPEAIEHYQQAVQLKPDYQECYVNLARAYAKLNRSQEAIATAHKALELARAAGRADKVQQMEAWLSAYRASLKNSPVPSSGPGAASPSP